MIRLLRVGIFLCRRLIMSDKMGLSKIKIFPVDVMGRIANEHITAFNKRVEGGIDAKGKKFKSYTPSYAEYKRSGFKSKRTGKRIPSLAQGSLDRQTNPPNLKLTGLMMRNLHRKSYKKDHYVIGFTGEPAEKAQYNEAMGRDIINNIPDKEKKFIVDRLEKNLGIQFNKLKNVTITIGK